MAITKEKKQSQLADLEEKFKNSEGIAFVRFFELTVEEAQKARRDLREKGMSYTVIKKTLIALAAKNAGKVEFSSDDLDGAVAVIVSESDAIAPAAAIKQLKKDTYDKEAKSSKFDFAGCVFEGKFLGEKETAELAEIPSREESIAKIVGALKSGPQRIHGALSHGFRGICVALKEADKFAKSE